MTEIPSEKNGMGASVLLLQEPREWADEDWFDRIQRAKNARRVGGRRLV